MDSAGGNVYLLMRQAYPAGSEYAPGSLRGKMWAWAQTAAAHPFDAPVDATDEMAPIEETNSIGEWESTEAIKFDQVSQVTQEPVEERLGESLRKLLEMPVAPREASGREHKWQKAEPSNGSSGGGGFGDEGGSPLM